MPKPDDAGVSDEEASDNADDVVVDLDAEVGKKTDPVVETPEQIEARLRAQLETEVEQKYRPFRNQAENLRRQNEQLQRALAERGTVAPKADAPDGKPKDVWATVENGAVWRQEIERLAEQKAQERLERWQQEQAVLAEQAQRVTVLSQSKTTVTTLYPELDPETGDEEALVSQLFKQVLNEDPTLKVNPHGPEIAMYRMEHALKEQGVAPRSWGTGTTGKAAAGVAAGTKVRASATGLPPSRPGTGSNTVTLSADERALCDSSGIKYEDYARTRKSLETAGGLEL